MRSVALLVSLRVEILEDRLVPTFDVWNPADAGVGTLREAIEMANAEPGENQITFVLSGAPIIQLTSALPTITDSIVIDGTSQDRIAGVARVEIHANAPNIFTGLTLHTTGSQIRGLAITGFETGIRIEGGGGNRIENNYLGADWHGTGELTFHGTGLAIINSSNNAVGGSLASERNIVSANEHGIILDGAGSQFNKIQGNYIGTSIDGSTALGNLLHGIRIVGAKNNLIGGPASGEGNVVAGSGREGIYIEGATAEGNRVQGNLIGTNASGAGALANREGINIGVGAHDNVIGGSGTGEGNLVSGNRNDGIQITNFYQSAPERNVILGNRIGLASDGLSLLPNGGNGVWIFDSPRNVIGGVLNGEANRISGNGDNGVGVSGNGAVGNRISVNTYDRNVELPIDLGGNGLDENDYLDTDFGPNTRLNAPVIGEVQVGSSVFVTGNYSSDPNRPVVLHFYAQSTIAGPTRYLGSSNAVTGNLGRVSFETTLTQPLAVGEWVSAVAMDAVGNTSEFSVAQQAGPVQYRKRFDTKALAASIFDYSSLNIRGDGERSVPLNGVLRGDRVTITAQLYQGLGGGASQFEVQSPGGHLTLAGGYPYIETQTLTYTAPADGGVIIYSFPGWDNNDFANITIHVDRTNLVALTPARNADGSITFGSRVDNVSVDPRGQFIGVELRYANFQDGKYVINGGSDGRVGTRRPINTAAGSPTTYTVAYDDIPAGSEGFNSLISWVNPNIYPETVAIPETTRSDNVSSKLLSDLLPNFAPAPIKIMPNGEIQYGVVTTQAPSGTRESTASLYYARSGDPADIISRVESMQSGALSGWNKTVYLGSIPAEAKYLIAIVNEGNALPESNRTDNVTSIPLKSILPDYIVQDLTWQSDGSLRIRYANNGNKSKFTTIPRLAMFWADVNTIDDILDYSKPIIKQAMPSASGSVITVDAKTFTRPPAGATHVVAVADFDKAVSEVREDNNSLGKAIRPPDIRIARKTNGSYDYGFMNGGLITANGDFEVKYEIVGSLAPGKRVTAVARWGGGGQILGNIREFDLGRSTTGKLVLRLTDLIHLPADADSVQFVFDQDDAIEESEERNNTLSLNFTQMKLNREISGELGSPLKPPPYPATTRFDLVLNWLEANSSTIVDAERRFQVDRRAIAGAIAWEALINSNGSSLKGYIYGPGKVHPIDYYNFSVFHQTDSSIVENSVRYGTVGILPSLFADVRRKKLTETYWAVNYIAAIMHAFEVEAIDAGQTGATGFRYRPGLIATFFNGVQPPELKGKYLTLRNANKFFSTTASSGRSLQDSEAMGQWITHNLDFLTEAVGQPWT